MGIFQSTKNRWGKLGGRRAAGSGSETFNRPWRVQIWLSSNHWICQNIVCVLLNKVLFSEFQLRWNRIGFPLHFLSHPISLSLSGSHTQTHTCKFHANDLGRISSEFLQLRISTPVSWPAIQSTFKSNPTSGIYYHCNFWPFPEQKKKMRFMLIR